LIDDDDVTILGALYNPESSATPGAPIQESGPGLPDGGGWLLQSLSTGGRQDEDRNAAYFGIAGAAQVGGPMSPGERFTEDQALIETLAHTIAGGTAESRAVELTENRLAATRRRLLNDLIWIDSVWRR
jgi:hypothetical protein